MMIYENVQLHNVAEARRIPGRDGVRLQRVPERVRRQLNAKAQMRMLNPDACEIRFLTDSPTARVTLSSEGRTKVTCFFGLFHSSQRFVIGPEPQTIEITMRDRLPKLDQSYWADMPFSPIVFRLIMGGPEREPIYFHSVEGDNVRPPEPGDLPKLRYLAYGTSITHGASASASHLTYAAQAARHLGADLINLGVGGAAQCEGALADHMAHHVDWDIASLALSVNMQGFALDEFYRRVSYMVNTVAGADTSRPVACITLYPYFRDFGVEPTDQSYGGTPDQYREALRDAVAACPYPNAHLVEGSDILTDMTGLTGDLIHPGDNGMIEMGRNLAAKLRQLME